MTLDCISSEHIFLHTLTQKLGCVTQPNHRKVECEDDHRFVYPLFVEAAAAASQTHQQQRHFQESDDLFKKTSLKSDFQDGR